MLKGRVLIIAGSDSGGGAGLQADIKTITTLRAYAATAVTALTVQNTQGVHDVFDVPADVVAHQMRVVLTDIGADALKSGMLPRADIIKAVASVIRELAPGIPYVLDPVMVAKGGAALIDDEAVSSLKSELLPLCEIVTPNAPEASVLTGRSIDSLTDMRSAAAELAGVYGCAVLLKGGHLDSAIIHDVFFHQGATEVMSEQRIVTNHTHGTGCTLASAIAAQRSQGVALDDAVLKARQYVRQAIKMAPGLGKGHGPLAHLATFPDSSD